MEVVIRSTQNVINFGFLIKVGMEFLVHRSYTFAFLFQATNFINALFVFFIL